jgi:poly(3-hydroxybutyrate) depolymerase
MPYDATSDATFIPELLAEMEKGSFGPVDMTHLYATGISSGGYMTSRMAVSYPGRFRALAIESGSYATCLGPLCTIPDTLPADHPPTLFLHGAADTTVPISTARAYDDALKARGIETKFVEDAAAGHQWITAAPEAVLDWFTTH